MSSINFNALYGLVKMFSQLPALALSRDKLFLLSYQLSGSLPVLS